MIAFGGCEVDTDSLGHVCPTSGPPGCILWPMATLVRYTHIIKINFKRLGTTLIVIFKLCGL
jgi:hypothetical protein